jgi:hypothetical protein
VSAQVGGCTSGLPSNPSHADPAPPPMGPATVVKCAKEVVLANALARTTRRGARIALK